MIGIVGLGIVGAFLVDGDVTRFDQRRAVGAQQVALGAIRAGEHVDGNRVEYCVTHLRGDGALPDQRIQLVQVGVDLAFDAAQA